MSTATISPTVVALAFRAQRELNGLLHPDFTADTRTHVLNDYRRQLANAIAESATGVTAAEAGLTSRYSRSQLSDRQIERARRYWEAHRHALTDLPTDYEDLLVWCEIACGVRRAEVAA